MENLLALKCEPGKEATLATIVNLDFYINPNNISEYDLGDAWVIFDKKAGEKNLPMNRFVEMEKSVDILSGIMLILKKDEDGNYISIDDETSKKYMKKFKHPELFFFVGDKLHVVKVRYGTEYILTRTFDLFTNEKDETPDDVVMTTEEELNGN